MNIPRQLRPGRHQLSREEVATNQRDRILRALESVMSEKGYLDTSVADVIKVAGVSRQTFYEQFSCKRDCFVASFERRQRSLIDWLEMGSTGASPLERFSGMLRNYLTVMSIDPGLSRLYLIGVYAAGPEAIARRFEMQQMFVDAMASVLDVSTEEGRFTCQALVATISTMVTQALGADDPQAVLDLHEPLTRLTERLLVGL